MVSLLEFNLIKKSLEKWGSTSQILMAIEELNELSVSLCHSLRNNKWTTKKDVVEEITDVRLMLDQIEYMFNITNKELSDMREQKILRLHKLLEEDNNENQ